MHTGVAHLCDQFAACIVPINSSVCVAEVLDPAYPVKKYRSGLEKGSGVGWTKANPSPRA
jgi:hypothetical protein